MIKLIFAIVFASASIAAADLPDFGPNVLIFDPSTPAIQSQLNAIFAKQQRGEFNTNRYAILFKPGQYNLDIQVGYYTQILGLGSYPDDVQITGTSVPTAAEKAPTPPSTSGAQSKTSPSLPRATTTPTSGPSRREPRFAGFTSAATSPSPTAAGRAADSSPTAPSTASSTPGPSNNGSPETPTSTPGATATGTSSSSATKIPPPKPGPRGLTPLSKTRR